jgi:hypothetical protein
MNRVFQLAAFGIMAFILVVSNDLLAQCCSPGNPIGGTFAPGQTQKGMLQLFLNYKYGYAGEYFDGAEPAESQFIKNGNYNFIGANMALGISTKLSLEADAGYYLNKTQYFNDGIIPPEMVGIGITDLNVGLKYNFYRNNNADWEITGGGGIKIPLGSYDQMYKGGTLTRDLQPSTGSFDFFANLFIYKGYVDIGLRFFVVSRFELKSMNPDMYRYGNFFSNSFFTSYSLSPNWLVLLQFRHELRWRDSRPDTGTGIPADNGREMVIPSGSQKIFVIPQVTYLVNRVWDFSALLDLPLYQYYNNKQLSTTYAVTLSIHHTIPPKSKETPVPVE